MGKVPLEVGSLARHMWNPDPCPFGRAVEALERFRAGQALRSGKRINKKKLSRGFALCRGSTSPFRETTWIHPLSEGSWEPRSQPRPVARAMPLPGEGSTFLGWKRESARLLQHSYAKLLFQSSLKFSFCVSLRKEGSPPGLSICPVLSVL